MDILGLVEVPGWLFWTTLTIVLLFGYSYYKQSTFRKLGIPGPKPRLLLGTYNNDEIESKGMVVIDAELIKKYGRVVGLFAMNVPQMLIADPEMVKQILVKEFPNFSDRAALLPATKPFSEFLSVVNGDHWRFLRGTISPTFTSGKMRSMQPMIERCVSRLMNSFKDSTAAECVDVKPLFGSYVVETICATAFGIDIDSQGDPDHPFVQNAKKAATLETKKFSVFLNLLIPELSPVITRMASSVLNKDMTDFFVAVCKKSLEDRRLHKSDHKDFLQIMVDSQKEAASTSRSNTTGSEFENYKARGITDDEILANALIFFLAGYDTTGNVMVWIAYCLATNPEEQDRLIQEIDERIGKDKPTYDAVMNLSYLDMVFNETLRLYPPASRISRLCLKDIEICGQFIPKGMDVNFPVFAMHRDPEFWPEPEKFDPERFAPENKGSFNQYAFLPFGHGPRNCIGTRLAMLQTKLALVSVLQRFRFRRSDKTQVPPVFAKTSGNIFLSPANGMLLKIEVRNDII